MEKGNKVLIKDIGSVWDGKRGTVILEEDGQVEVRINFETEDGTKQVIEIFDEENLEMEREDESLNEQKEHLEESLNYEKTDDIIHPYIYLKDLDDKEIPAWNFVGRIAAAEDLEEGCVCELAHNLGYKVFCIEAPGFDKCVIAAKGIKAEDIEEDYADFLQGRACVRELNW